ncbi:MAG: type I-B CRISPR-associated protein Cas7/Cst2/DevR [Candidatus Thermoplasmatota archaeon]|nr:type I-B CRISPR-associated protein Cas7/Cst2/DevR [Candidatus Thermoplasmatota archaeon]
MKTVVGMMLVDAPHSALNNAGMEAGERTENIVRTKVIQKDGKTYPYVSGQALRYWWRAALKEKFGWKMSPLTREEKIVYSEANPLEYPDDDVFGYMRAPKGRGSETVTRSSPLKVSPLVSVFSQRPVQDYGTASRQEGDPVPYEHEFYSTVLEGIFSLDIDRVGVFTSENRTGYKNITKKLEKQLNQSDAKRERDAWILPPSIRKKRIGETVQALPYLFGGAMASRHLTDVSPKFLIMALIEGGNHVFMNLVSGEGGKVNIDLDGVLEVAKDYDDIFLTPIYIGRRQGFLNEIDGLIQEKIVNNSKKDLPEFKYGSINEMVDQFTQKVGTFLD